MKYPSESTWAYVRFFFIILAISGLLAYAFCSCTSTNPKTIEKERYEKGYYEPVEL